MASQCHHRIELGDQGTGNTRRVILIASEMTEQERNFAGDDRNYVEEKEIVKDQTRDPDQKIPKKPRKEESQEEGRIPYQPGGKQGDNTQNKTPYTP